MKATALETFQGLLGYTSKGEWGPESDGWETATIEEIITYSEADFDDDGYPKSREGLSIADAKRVQMACRLMQLIDDGFHVICRALDDDNWT